MALVSIIIPYFGKKSFIQKTLTSVLNQTFQDFEIILIYDDENKDDLVYIKKILNENNKVKATPAINKKDSKPVKSKKISIK